MIKIVSCFVSLFLVLNINAQNKLLDILPLKDSKVIYSKVVEVENVSKLELYNRSCHWLVDSFRTVNLIQLDDKNNYEIIGKGFFEKNSRSKNIKVWQTIKILIKDNRYRVEITDFRMEYYFSSMDLNSYDRYNDKLEELNNNQLTREFCLLIDSKIKALLESLEKMMKAPQITANW